MKRTTYIIIGMLLAVVVAMSGVFLYMSTLHTSREDSFYKIGGEMKTVQLPECKSVEFFMNGAEGKHLVSFTELPLMVSPTDAATGSLTFAADLEKYMTLREADDVLWIEFQFPAEGLGSPYDKQNWLRIRSAAMQLSLPANVQRVGSDIIDFRGTFRGFRSDTLSIWMSNYAELEDCRINSLSASGRDLNLKSGEVRNLYLNLDVVDRWNVDTDSFHIDTEHLTGSGDHRCELQKGECRQVLWTPLTENASLNLDLKQAAKIEVQ